MASEILRRWGRQSGGCGGAPSGRAGRRSCIGNRGCRPANRVDEATRARIVALRRTTYRVFNDTQLAERLAAERPPISFSVRTVRRVVRAAGIGSVWRRRARQNHRRPDRKPQRGLMLLWDDSRHAWLETRGPLLTLVEPSTTRSSELLPGAHFLEQASAAAYLRLLHALATAGALPASA